MGCKEHSTPDPLHALRLLSRVYDLGRSSVIETGRLLQCKDCRCSFTICSMCFRGQVYCSKTCAAEGKKKIGREASREYQATSRGKRKHAARQMQFRNKKVTHHRSEAQKADLKRRDEKNTTTFPPIFARSSSQKVNSCEQCGCRVSFYLRI